MPSFLWHHHGCKIRSRLTGTEHMYVLDLLCLPLVESWQKQQMLCLDIFFLWFIVFRWDKCTAKLLVVHLMVSSN